MTKQPTKAQMAWLEKKMSKARPSKEVNSLGTHYYFKARVKAEKWEFCFFKWVSIDLPHMGRFSLQTRPDIFIENPLTFELIKE